MGKEIICIMFLLLFSLSNSLYLENKTMKLTDQEECQDDIERFCPDKKFTNLVLLGCLQDSLPTDKEISLDCQHLVWQIKWNITRGTGLYVPSKNFALCSADAENLPSCKKEKEDGGPYVACLVKRIKLVKNPSCVNFLHLLQPLIYTDFRFIYRLADVCNKDIEALKCGRNNNYYFNRQGTTIDCLAEHLDDLFIGCRKEVLKLAELQANDWKTDRGLYLACREDKFKFCDSNLPAEPGLVYKCLLKHKEDEAMTKECKTKLRLRQKLQSEDYAVNYQFFHSCQEDMEANKCTGDDVDGNEGGGDGGNGGNDGDDGGSSKHKMKLSMVVLCLEKAKVNGKHLKGQCLHEMLEVRRQLMEDHRINPELMKSCKSEVTLCENPQEVSRLHEQGMLSSLSHRYVIHCIMDLTRHTFMHSQTSDSVSKQCYYAVSRVLKDVDVIDHIDVDPALKYDCAITISKHCADVPRGEGMMINCLMGLLGSDKMDNECSNRISEIQFFIARDFKLSTRFWVTCRSDMNRLCLPAIAGANKAAVDKAAADKEIDLTTDVIKQAHLLSCLYRNFDNKISEGCSKQVHVVMEERARSVDLLPEMQMACLTDLAQLCQKSTGRDDEMSCLEDNYEKLTEACQTEVSRVVDAEDEVPLLTRLFLDACESFWDQHCMINRENATKRKSLIGGLNGGDDKESEDEAVYLMECLIKNKNHQEMPKKCRIGIEHHQLVSLKHFNFNSHFKRACSKDINDHCAKLTDKASVIKCLSEWVYNDTMMDIKHHVTKKCRKQLNFEVLQTKETINLDDEIRADCRADRKKFCDGVLPGKGAVVGCLKQHQKELSEKCRALLFVREEKEAASPDFDFTLVTKCKRMIKVYCDGSTDLFNCLKSNKEDEEFDEGCRDVVVERMRLRAQDIRLNPALMRDCQVDIMRECKKSMELAKAKPFEADGIVLYCLRMVFVHKIKRQHMTVSCAKHMTELLRESAIDDLQDTVLISQCSEAIKEKCVEEAEVDKRKFGGTRVEECLKRNLMGDERFREQNALCFHEIIRRMTESKVDIHIDPLLYRLCSLDAKTVCRGVVPGESRVMTCLMMTMSEDASRLTEGCRKALSERTELFNKAVKLAPPESVGELVNHIQSSSAHNFFEFLLLSVVMLIFCGGLLCGRVTKRVSRQMKSK